ncbi:hypothetical protein HS1genome_0585 [Sulfodiicoccus acidiphilus]|uniref:Uncharacterized protein n=1 Tax=Sulfodiicoccus acidiphilus TaxID=1670455 RepID=A0A348B1Z4_9CREN|nr:hypothetical protein [Sulfodiicoccus acidiphilus]BBD72196.1 hypothetical protein HS1genome_0585 [Sulfodiicoccus acidiphilus]GGT94291.1 hypothetical protein GCM10007116_09850 [Sulfodiicoccus acidiphilus]
MPLENMRAAIYAIVVGALLLGLVFSTTPFFTYQDTRLASVTITADPAGPLSLVPNDHYLGYGSGPSASAYVYLNASGDLTINLNKVQTNAMMTISPAFFVDDNLNQTVTVTMTVTEVSGPTSIQLLVNGTAIPHTFTFTLSPSEGEVPVYLTLETYGTMPGQSAVFHISFTETYG